MSKTVDSLFVRRLAGLGLAVALAASTPLAGPAGRAEAETLSDVSIADMAERLLPSVVNISISQEGDGDAGDRPVPKVPEGQPFEEFFEDFFDGQGGPGSRPVSSLGSGFIIDPAGIIVTNNEELIWKCIHMSGAYENNYKLQINCQISLVNLNYSF